MIRKICIAILFIMSLANLSHACRDDLHLVILSGQSNIGAMPLVYFTDTINGEIGTNHTVIVKHALGQTHIALWDEKLNGVMYAGMMNKVYAALEEFPDRELTSITFIWGQGAQDAIWNLVDQYQESFDRLLFQLKRDLGRDDIHLIIGRTTDYVITGSWAEIRELQEFIGSTYPLACWVDTDDLNGLYNTIHFTYPMYKVLAERYADIILDRICSEGY